MSVFISICKIFDTALLSSVPDIVFITKLIGRCRFILLSILDLQIKKNGINFYDTRCWTTQMIKQRATELFIGPKYQLHLDE